jgi:hypothetical protein
VYSDNPHTIDDLKMAISEYIRNVDRNTLFENTVLLREILTWGRESGRQAFSNSGRNSVCSDEGA